MTVRLFGTDGVRGRVGSELTAEISFRLGRAAAGYYLERGVREVLLARDTRISGDMLASAFLAGVTSIGSSAVDLGIAPTPAVSWALAGGGSCARFGVVISASHNPYEDNGIKVFAPDGTKLPAAEEAAIERRVKIGGELDASDAQVGRVRREMPILESYIRSIRSRFPVSLKKLSVVIDAAHGAWSPHVKVLFSNAAASVIFLNDTWTGTDINADCGSTHVDRLDPHLSPTAVGLAFDGDGDRCLVRIADLNSKSAIQNPQFKTVDGDAMLFLFAKHLVSAGPVVGTVMSNGSLAAALDSTGRVFFRAPVGDREVYELMVRENSKLGGEQSGHIIFRENSGGDQRTGDGAVTALAFLKVLSENYGENLSALIQDLPAPYPQKLVNLRVSEKRPWEQDPDLSSAVESARSALGPNGRLLVRYSGTEPLLRFMAEGPSAKSVEAQLDFLVSRFRARLSS